MMKKVILFLLTITVLALSSVLTGCENDEETNTTEEAVRTPEIIFPDLAGEIGDEVSVEHTVDADVECYTFSAHLGEGDYALYSIYFGAEQRGELYGYISGEERPVYVECHSLPDDNSLTELQRQRYYSLMDGINTVVDAINGLDGFIPV